MKAVITCITSGVDNLITGHVKQDASFIAFVDSDIKSNLWDIRKAPIITGDSRRDSRIVKWMPHKYVDCDYSLWIDGNVIVGAGLDYLIEKYLKDKDIAMRVHYDRDCLYDEAKVCISELLDNPEIIKAQIRRYRAEGYPKNYGLHDGGVILRRHTQKINEFGEAVWNEIKNGSTRDQLALDYVAWKLDIKITDMPDRKHDPYFIKVGHRINKKQYGGSN